MRPRAEYPSHAMARVGLATSGKSLRWGQGVAGWRIAPLEYMVRRSALTALAVGALIAGLSATSVALQGDVDPGVIATELEPTVISVNPTGLGWAAGIRHGDVVVSVIGIDKPGGWQMVTRDSQGNLHTADGATASEGLAASLPIGIAS